MGLRWILGGVLVVALTAAGGAFAGAMTLEWTGSTSELETARVTVASFDRELAARDGRIATLEARIEELRDEAASLQERVANRDRTISELESALGHSGPLSEQYASLASRHAELRAEFEALAEVHGQLVEGTSSLIRIRTPELTGDALLFDRSVEGVRYTRALCSGSMEPSISCNDLLLMYRPDVTDLDVGDVIQFRRQQADCSGPTASGSILHRIVRLVVRDDGLHFETKGDANNRPDACLVPARDVMYKLLASVRNARIQ
jgi:signal peptidase I